MSDQRPPLRIAFWGQNSSGKTAILARYYHYINAEGELIDLRAVDPAKEEKLKKWNDQLVVGLKVTELQSTKWNDAHCYEFHCRPEKGTKDVLLLEWIDYPGKWWGVEKVRDEEDMKRRREFFKKLCTANVVFLLVDADGWLDKDHGGSQYVKALFKEIADEIAGLDKYTTAWQDFGRPDRFVIALSKSDRFTQRDKEFSAKRFQEKLKEEAGPELAHLWAVCKTPQAEQRYLLLSILQADKNTITSTTPVGLDAIAPLALEKALRDAERQLRGEGEMKKQHGETSTTASGVVGAVGAAAAPILGPVLGVALPPLGLAVAGVSGFLLLAGYLLKRSGTADGERAVDALGIRELLKAKLDQLKHEPYYWDATCR